MTEQPRPEPLAWRVGRSIAMELDVAVSAFGLPKAEREQSAAGAALVAAVPADWEAQWPELLGHSRRWVNVFAEMASLAGALFEEDYARATLAMRELTLAEALKAATAQAASFGIEPNAELPLAEQLADVTQRLGAALVRALRLEPASEARMAESMSRESAHMVRLIKGGDLHSRFWLWIDRFYFEFYRPWREERRPTVEALERQAVAALGGYEGTCAPDLSWLPPQNPAVMRTDVVNAVQERGIPILFWTDPFGFFDYWSFSTQALTVSYGQPSEFLAGFRAQAAEISERAKALADPTRLAILRLIRQFAMDNTQMADYLGVARPTVSIHSKILREAGLIETRQAGRAALHTLNAAEVRRLFQDLERFLRLSDVE